MSNVLVVVYSHTGTARKVARLLASLQGWTLAEITEDRARGNLRCILDSLLRRTPPIRYTGPAPQDFDAVVLVAPIWAGRLAGPMRSFVASWAAQLRRVAVVTVMGSRGGANADAEIARRLGRAPMPCRSFKSATIEDGEFGRTLKRYARSIDDLLEADLPAASDRNAA